MENFINETNSLEIKFIDIFDLSLIELTILNYLVNNEGKILRFDLYKQINSLLAPFKNLSTSSFYNSLKKLENRGFLKSVKTDNKDPKSMAITKDKKAEVALGFMFYYFIQHSLSLSSKGDNDPSNIIKTLCMKENFDSVMVIDPETSSSTKLITSIIPTAVETLRSIARASKNIYLLSTEELYDYYISQGINKLQSSQIREEGIIREAENTFDLIVFPLYDKNIIFNDLNYRDLLKEAKRLLMKGGNLVVIHLEEFQLTNNYFLDHFSKSLRLSGYIAAFDTDQIMNDLLEIGYENLQITKNMGINYISATVN